MSDPTNGGNGSPEPGNEKQNEIKRQRLREQVKRIFGENNSPSETATAAAGGDATPPPPSSAAAESPRPKQEDADAATDDTAEKPNDPIDDPAKKPESPNDEADLAIDADMFALIDDARKLLEYALSGLTVDPEKLVQGNVIDLLVKVAYAYKKEAAGQPPQRIRKSDWVGFLKAYDSLCAQTKPVTARTLRDTETEDAPKGLTGVLKPKPPFFITRILWGTSIVFMVLAATTDYLTTLHNADAQSLSESGDNLRQLLEVLEPFVYGGLGACAYLLRSAHALIAARAFDASYIPEYLNRIMLGVISGGAATLFAGAISDADETQRVVALSQAAVGFLAGYSTDFLFKTIERLLEALFPRTNPPAKN